MGAVLSSENVADSPADAWPIGAVFISISQTNPAALLGGTWTAFAAGRVLVGVDPAQSEFDTVLETGGAKTHTLTAAEMPAHTHVQNAHTHLQQTFPTATGGSTGFTVDTSMSGTPGNANATGAATAVNQNTGGGAAHNNLQPYLTVFMWLRTA